MRTLTIATRKSPLAMWQATTVQRRLQAQYPDLTIHLLPMTTSGDRASQQNWPLEKNNKGLFIKELETALLEKRADLAVHSIKDMPAILPAEFTLACICERGNPFDAFVSPQYASIDALPFGARVGTTSLRRQSQLLAYRPDLQIAPLRGNVQTRLDKLNQGEFDAILLAAAGLERLELASLIRMTLTPPMMIPAAGQGAIGIECRIDDQDLQERLQALSCSRTTRCVQTERAVSAALGGSCHVPVAIFCAFLDNHTLQLTARVLNDKGSTVIEACETNLPDHAPQMAAACVERLFEQGAAALLS